MIDTTQLTLTAKQMAIGPIAAATAVGNMPALEKALHRALDAGLNVAEAKEVLLQLYAYAGFPRALNALGEMMKVMEERRRLGIKDNPGREPGVSPSGIALLDVGTENQTKLSGAPVKGAIFDFSPAIDNFLKVHLFGAIFSRDNLDWPDRELATLAALSALSGVEAQLLAHIRISMNVGLTVDELRQFAEGLTERGELAAGERLFESLDKHVSATLKS